MAEEHQDKPETKAPDLRATFESFADHQRKAAKEACDAVVSLLPPDFRTHSRTAGDEFARSLQVLADGVMSVMEHELKRMRTSTQTGPGGGPSTTGKSKVKVEVS